MTSKSITHGNYCFILPDDFVLFQPSTIAPEHTRSACGHGHTPLCLTLTKVISGNGTPEYPEYSNSYKLSNYPETILITSLPKTATESPLAFLRNSDALLSHQFTGFKTDFHKTVESNKQDLAMSQSSFLTNFRIFRLCYAWFLNDDVLICTLTTHEQGIDNGWPVLERFVNSFAMLH